MHPFGKIIAVLIIPVVFAICTVVIKDDFVRIGFEVWSIFSGIAAMFLIGFIVFTT